MTMLSTVCRCKRFSYSSAVSVAWIAGFILGSLILFLQKESVLCYADIIHSPASFFGTAFSSVAPVLLALILAFFRLEVPYFALVFCKALIHGFSVSALLLFTEISRGASVPLSMVSQVCSCFLIIFSGAAMRHIRPSYRIHFCLSVILTSVLVSFLSLWFSQ